MTSQKLITRREVSFIKLLGIIMENKTKIPLTFGIVATVSSAPLALMLTETISDEQYQFVKVLMYCSPILIGIAAVVWYYILAKFAKSLWVISPAVFGAVVGLLTFLTFACGYGIGAEMTGEGRFTEAFHMVGGFGLLLFGWIPIVFGAFSGWLGAKLAAYDA